MRENRFYLVVAGLALVLGIGPHLWSEPFDVAADAIRRLTYRTVSPPSVAREGLSPFERTLLEENRRLRETAALAETMGEQAVVASVVRREPEHWWRSLWVLLETSGDRPQRSALVFSESGLIGYLEPGDLTELDVGRGSSVNAPTVRYLAEVELLTAAGVRLAVSFPESAGLFFLEGTNRAQFRLHNYTVGQGFPKESRSTLMTAGTGHLFGDGYPVARWSADKPGEAQTFLESTPAQVVVWWR